MSSSRVKKFYCIHCGSFDCEGYEDDMDLGIHIRCFECKRRMTLSGMQAEVYWSHSIGRLSEDYMVQRLQNTAKLLIDCALQTFDNQRRINYETVTRRVTQFFELWKNSHEIDRYMITIWDQDRDSIADFMLQLDITCDRLRRQGRPPNFRLHQVIRLADATYIKRKQSPEDSIPSSVMSVVLKQKTRNIKVIRNATESRS